MTHSQPTEQHGSHQDIANTKQHQSDTHNSGHGVDHTGHEIMFRNRFWVSLVLSIPVLLYSPALQEWLNFSMPAFPGSGWIAPLFAIIIFFYGGLPFLQMAGPEVKNRQPGMMLRAKLNEHEMAEINGNGEGKKRPGWAS